MGYRFPLSPTLQALEIWDTNATHKLTFDWDEDDTSNRNLLFKVNAGSRTVDLSGNLTVEAASILNQDLTSDASPQFTALNIGHATDTTLARSGAGDLTIEGNAIYRAAGTDVAVADGGTNFSTIAAGSVLGANTIDVIVAINSTTGLKVLENNAGTVAWATVTGTASPVYSTSPTLVTPDIGVATATSVNKVTITTPATSATLTIVDGKTLTISNTLSFAGTDSTVMTFPAASDTVAALGTQQTFTKGQAITIANTVNQVPLVITNNDTTNNLDTLQVVNTTTGAGVWINQDGNAVALSIDSESTNTRVFSIDSVTNSYTTDGIFNINLVPAKNQNVNVNAFNITYGLTVDDAGTYTKQGTVFSITSSQTQTSGTITDSVVLMSLTQSGDTGNVANFVNAGTGTGLFIDENGNGKSIYIDTEATSTNAIDIDSVNTSGSVVDINNGPGGASTAILLNITANNQHSTNNVIQVTNAGTASAFDLNQTGIVASNYSGVNIYSNAAQTTMQSLLDVFLDNVSSTKPALRVVNDGTGNGIFVDQNADSYGFQIDKDCTVNDTRTWAMRISSDNAGTGTALGCGIDMSLFSVDEPVFKFVADAITGLGTLSGQYAIDVGGTTYYIPYYTTGT